MEAGFLVSPKSTLDLATHLFCVGKFLDLESEEIFCIDFALAKLGV